MLKTTTPAKLKMQSTTSLHNKRQMVFSTSPNHKTTPLQTIGKVYDRRRERKKEKGERERADNEMFACVYVHLKCPLGVSMTTNALAQSTERESLEGSGCISL